MKALQKIEPLNGEVISTIDFIQAIKAIKDGKKVSRLKWGSNIFVVLYNGTLVQVQNNMASPWTIQAVDFNADDYLLI